MQIAATVESGTSQQVSKVRGRSKRLSERVIEALLVASGLVSVLTTAGILFVLASEALQFFAEVSLWDFLSGTEWTPLFANAKFGILPLLMGTLLTSAIALSVALPFGLLAAIYLSEFAPAWSRRILKPTLELLAGVPTIVYGYFALVFLTPALQSVVPGLSGFNALSAGIVMGIMIIPMISSLSEDALSAVPNALREAALGLGGTKLSSILRVVVPAATSGVAASVILALSRAIGETMIVAIAAGQQPRFTLDPRVPIETMTTYIVQISMGDVPTGTLEYRTIFAVGSALFVMTFAMNVVSQRLSRRFRER
ncbi:MAG: phosphate ABC transporter permease subunit PstC [Myxococcales bacterium]